MSPIAEVNVVAVMTLTPGTLISRRTSGEPVASIGDRSVERVDLAGEEVDLAQPSVDRVALVGGELELGEPGAAGFAEQVAHRRFAFEVADQDRVDLVLGAGAGPHQLGASCEPPALRPGHLVREPAPRQESGREQPGEHPRVEPIGLGLRPCDRLEVTLGRDDDPLDPRLEDPRDRERVAGRLERDLVVGPQTVREDLELLGRGLDPAGEANVTVLADRDRAEVAVDVESDEPHAQLSLRLGSREQVGIRHRRIRARGTTGSVAEAASEYSGLAAHQPKLGLPILRIPRRLCPGHAVFDDGRAGTFSSVRNEVSCPEY